jgi:hypothetical protein
MKNETHRRINCLGTLPFIALVEPVVIVVVLVLVVLVLVRLPLQLVVDVQFLIYKKNTFIH